MEGGASVHLSGPGAYYSRSHSYGYSVPSPPRPSSHDGGGTAVVDWLSRCRATLSRRAVAGPLALACSVLLLVQLMIGGGRNAPASEVQVRARCGVAYGSCSWHMSTLCSYHNHAHPLATRSVWLLRQWVKAARLQLQQRAPCCSSAMRRSRRCKRQPRSRPPHSQRHAPQKHGLWALDHLWTIWMSRCAWRLHWR